jgi:hypothetical protein
MEELMKFALTSCVSALLTGLGAWIAFGRKTVTRDELDATRAEMLRLVEANTQAMSDMKEEFHLMRISQEQHNTLLRQHLGLPPAALVAAG